MPPRRLTDEERLDAFFSKIDFGVGDDTCWLWEGSRTSNGYGQFRFLDCNWQAHRVAWTLLVGPIPEGMELCHTCDVRACVNPAHIFVGTHQDNMDDMGRKGRRRTGSPGRRGAWQRAKIQCKNGHPFDDGNTEWIIHLGKYVTRRCVTCRKATANKYARRMRAEVKHARHQSHRSPAY